MTCWKRLHWLLYSEVAVLNAGSLYTVFTQLGNKVFLIYRPPPPLALQLNIRRGEGGAGTCCSSNPKPNPGTGAAVGDGAGDGSGDTGLAYPPLLPLHALPFLLDSLHSSSLLHKGELGQPKAAGGGGRHKRCQVQWGQAVGSKLPAPQPSPTPCPITGPLCLTYHVPSYWLPPTLSSSTYPITAP